MILNSFREKFIFYYLPIILFSLIPFFLITGPFLSDLAVSIISLLFIIYCFSKKNFSFFKNKYFYFFIIFWGYLVVNSLINNFDIKNFGTSFVYLRYGIFMIAIVAFLNFDNKFIKYFFYCILICFIIIILDGYYQYFSGENILGWKFSSRTSSFFGEEKILGSYLSRLWPIFFGISILIINKKDKLFLLIVIVFILSESLIFLSGERAAFFYINLSAIFVILFSQKLMKLRLFTLLTSILLLAFISYINPTAKERIFDETLKGMNLTSKAANEDIYIFTKAHHEMYISAFNMFLENKFIGVGIKNFRNKCNDPKFFVNNKSVCNTHPHNTYLQILAETGIIGFLFLLTLLFYFIRSIFKHSILKFKGQNYFTDFEVCILSGILIYLWPLVPTGNFFNNWLSIAMFLNFPFLIWSRS